MFPNRDFRVVTLVVTLVLAGGIIACSDGLNQYSDDSYADTTESPAMDLEKKIGVDLAGLWQGEWNTSHTITSGRWTQQMGDIVSVFDIVEYNNTDRYVIARNSDDNDYAGGLYSRFDWTVKDDAVYFCNSVYEASTAEEAENAIPADDTDPATTGCGNFTWNLLDPISRPFILGIFNDSWGTAHEVTSTLWTQIMDGTTTLFEIESIDCLTGTVIAHNSDSNEYFAGMYSRFDWTRKDGILYFCNSVYDASTAREAENSTAADDTDPATTGCGDFAWTVLTPTAFFMDTVISAPGHTGEGSADSNNAVNDVHGGGTSGGGTDVFSLGYDIETNGHLILSFKDYVIKNGPGADFVVYENAFQYDDNLTFMDPAVILVSIDGVTWVSVPFDYIADDETVYSADSDNWIGFAGITPVLFNADSNAVDPFDMELAGGDQFDLDNLPDEDPDAVAIKNNGFRFLMILPAASVKNPDTGKAFVKDGISNGPDIDGVYARHLTEK